jgi:hypothetical protein
LSFFSWHGQQQYSSSQPVFVFSTIGPVTGPSSSLVDVRFEEANADASSCLRLKMTRVIPSVVAHDASRRSEEANADASSCLRLKMTRVIPSVVAHSASRPAAAVARGART